MDVHDLRRRPGQSCRRPIQPSIYGFEQADAGCVPGIGITGSQILDIGIHRIDGQIRCDGIPQARAAAFERGLKTETIQIDKAGRLVLPKPFREEFNLVAGDKLRVSIEGKSIKLEPTDSAGQLVRKGGVLVFTGEFAEPITTEMVEGLIEEEREGRFAAATGKLGKR